MELKPSVFIAKSHRELVDAKYREETTRNYQTAALQMQSALGLSDAEMKQFHDSCIFLSDDNYDRVSNSYVATKVHPFARDHLFRYGKQTGAAANLPLFSEDKRQAALAVLNQIDPVATATLNGLTHTNKLVIFRLPDLLNKDTTQLATNMAHEQYHFASQVAPKTIWDRLDEGTMAWIKNAYPDVDLSEITRTSDGFITSFFHKDIALAISGYHTDDSFAMVNHTKVAAQIAGQSFEEQLDTVYQDGFKQSYLRNNFGPIREPLLVDAMTKIFGPNLEEAVRKAQYADRATVYELAQKDVPLQQAIDAIESQDLPLVEEVLWGKDYLVQKINRLIKSGAL